MEVKLYSHVYSPPQNAQVYPGPATHPKKRPLDRFKSAGTRRTERQEGGERPRRTVSLPVAVVAILLAAVILLSFAAGCGGAWLILQSRPWQNELDGLTSEEDPIDNSAGVNRPGSSSQNGGGTSGSASFADRAEACFSSVVQVLAYTQNAAGQSLGKNEASGVLIGRNANHKDTWYVATVLEVLDGASTVQVVLRSGQTLDASVIGRDRGSGLAMLSVQSSLTLSPAAMGQSAALRQGQAVYCIGNAFGFGLSVSDGVVELLGHTFPDGNSNLPQICHSATANPGCLGGGLFDEHGNLVGIVSGRYEAAEGGFSLAIPVDEAYPLLCDLIDWGYVRGLVSHGISAIEVTLDNLWQYSWTYGLDEVGVYILSSANTPELRQWDRIVSVAGTPISRVSDIDMAIAGREIGDRIEVVVIRNGTWITVSLELVEYIPPDMEIIW